MIDDDFIDDYEDDFGGGAAEKKASATQEKAKKQATNKSSINRLPTISHGSTLKNVKVTNESYEKDAEEEWGEDLEDPLFADPNKNKSMRN